MSLDAFQTGFENFAGLVVAYGIVFSKAFACVFLQRRALKGHRRMARI